MIVFIFEQRLAIIFKVSVVQMKPDFKERATELRRQGFSYSEILQEVPVSKSTLSLWLRSIELSKKQQARLAEKQLASAQLGAIAKKNQRIAISNQIKVVAKKELGKITHRELWLIGIALYWAEGTKAKEHNVSQGVSFSNSDSLMITLFLKWLRDIVKIPENDIKYEIYIHESSKNNIRSAIQYWAKVTNSHPKKFQYVYLKKNKIGTKRRNIGLNYYGLLKIRARKSTNFNRKISGWIEGILENCRIV